MYTRACRKRSDLDLGSKLSERFRYAALAVVDVDDDFDRRLPRETHRQYVAP